MSFCYKFTDFLRGHDLIGNFLTPKREIEFWRIDVYNKLFTKEGNLISSKEERKEEYRYKMQEFNVIYSLGELFYEKIYGENYREKFKYFLGIIENFLADSKNKEKGEEGLNDLIALLIGDIQDLFKKDEKDNKIQGTDGDYIRGKRKKIDEQKKSDLEYTLKIIFGEEILEKEEKNQANYKAKYKSNAKASDIPPFWDIRNQFKLQIFDIFPNNKKEIGLSPQRSIELIIKECYDVFFKGRVSDEKAEQELLKLKFAYALGKWKFQEVNRADGDRYLEHLRETALVLLREKKDVSFDEILVALLHDIIEDTDMDFRSIKFLFGEKIALATFLISKKSSLDYIPKNDKENYEKKEELQKSGLLNGNNKIKTRYLKIYQKIENIKKKFFLNLSKGQGLEKKETQELSGKNTQSEYKKLCEKIPKGIDVNVFEFLIDSYVGIPQKYKVIRNNDYFGHMESLDKFKEYTKKTAEELGLTLRDDEIEEIIKISLSAKFADRLHNLRTEEVKKDFSERNINKAKRKIEETKDYFYKISEEFDEKYGTYFHKELKKEVYNLEIFMEKGKVKKSTSNLIKSKKAA